MRVTKAFLLGAGLGTRLRPLTAALPKPLIPVFHRPLIHYALDHCLAAGIREFAINTHHLPEKWEEFFPGAVYQGAPITFFHEPELLETGGGIKNIQSWIGNDPIVVYNSDILTNLDLPRLIAAHAASDHLATLALRSTGPALHIALRGARVCDIHRMLGVAAGTHQFTGVYCIGANLLERLPAREKVSIIPAFLELAQEGRLGASIHDEGHWLDLGTREAYLDAHLENGLGPLIHPDSKVDATAMVVASAVGPGAVVGPHATILNTVLWPKTEVSAGAQLTNCIVFSSTPAAGTHHHADL